MHKREIKVTCDKIEEHLFPVISEFVHSGSKLFWISSHPFFLHVWTSLVNKWNGTCILLFRCSYCIYFQVLSNYLCFHSIALYFISVELSFKAIKYVSTSFFSCHWKIKSWTLLNTFYFFCTILGHNKLCIFT